MTCDESISRPASSLFYLLPLELLFCSLPLDSSIIAMDFSTLDEPLLTWSAAFMPVDSRDCHVCWSWHFPVLGR